MKGVLIFVIGFVLGIGAEWYGLKQLGSTAKKGADSAVEFVSEKKYDSCKETFYKESDCLNLEPQKVCDSELFKQCGNDPAAENAKKEKR